MVGKALEAVFTSHSFIHSPVFSGCPMAIVKLRSAVPVGRRKQQPRGAAILSHHCKGGKSL